jgi:hypothetical protein
MLRPDRTQPDIVDATIIRFTNDGIYRPYLLVARLPERLVNHACSDVGHSQSVS